MQRELFAEARANECGVGVKNLAATTHPVTMWDHNPRADLAPL